jgi:fructosamine-3-kinase
MSFLDLRDRKNMFYWQTNRKITAKQQKEIFLDRYQIVKKDEAIDAIESSLGKKVVSLSDPIEFGSVNTVRSGILDDGTKIVVRMHPHNVLNGYFWVESVATKKAKENGVATYNTLMVDDSMQKYSFAFIIMEALPGKTMKEFTDLKDFKNTETLVRETGRNVALIHNIKTEKYGFFDNEVAKNKGKLIGIYDSFDQHIFASLEEDLDYLVLQNVFPASQKDKIVKIFEDNKGLMNCSTPVLIHNDVADWNQVSDGVHITGMVDWDECFSGDPIMDFSAYSLFFGEPRMTWFKEGYQEISPIPDKFEEKFQLFKLRYLVSKLHLRKKRLTVYENEILVTLLKRGLEAMDEVFKYFRV